MATQRDSLDRASTETASSKAVAAATGAAGASGTVDRTRGSSRWRRYFLRRLVALPLLLLGLWTIPHRWCGRNAGEWLDGQSGQQQKLAGGLQQWINVELGEDNFSTGSARFDGEWLFGTYMMAGMGFGQTALEHPQWHERHVRMMETCIERIRSEEVQTFDRAAWGQSALESLDTNQHHAAYLGYFNLLLSLHRSLEPESDLASLNDAITDSLVRRIEQSPTMLLQTYPGEVYPVDNSAVIASIALHDVATGADHADLIARWKEECRRSWIDPETGLLFQAMVVGSQKPADAPRGSGTCLAAYFLSFADERLSRDLHLAARDQLSDTWLGFGMLREYPDTVHGGYGDIDSGPLVMGYSVSATGFCLAGCRIHGDGDLYKRIYATSYLFGAPLDRGGTRTYVSGGPLGDAIMFAMLTALPADQAKKVRP